MTDSTVAAALRECEEALARFEVHEHEYNACDGGKIAWANCQLRAAVLAAIARLEVAARLAGRLEQVESDCLLADTGRQVTAMTALYDERDRLRREAGK